MIAGFGYLLGSFMFQILPQYKDALSTFIMLLEMGELPIIFWLLIVGAKAQSKEQQIRP
jgi:Na+/H+-dicarboxylate symporter